MIFHQQSKLRSGLEWSFCLHNLFPSVPWGCLSIGSRTLAFLDGVLLTSLPQTQAWAVQMSPDLWQLSPDTADTLWDRSGCGCPGYWKSWQPCHGKKCSCSVHEFSVVWLRVPSFQPQRKHCPCSLLAWAQVTSMQSMIVEAIAGMACYLQGLTIGTETRTAAFISGPNFCQFPLEPQSILT